MITYLLLATSLAIADSSLATSLAIADSSLAMSLAITVGSLAKLLVMSLVTHSVAGDVAGERD